VGQADGQLPMQKTSHLLQHLLAGRRVLLLPEVLLLQEMPSSYVYVRVGRRDRIGMRGGVGGEGEAA